MKYSIRQTDTGWELVAENGDVVASTAIGGPDSNVTAQHAGYGEMQTALGQLIVAQLAAAAETAPTDPAEGDEPAGDGLLPEVWVSDQGIAFQEVLGGGRDFTQCEWSWRDPTTSLVPLMLQTETDYGHMGANLAGFVETFTNASGTVTARGRFYDSDVGTQFRDMLLGGRRFGVSVDATENVDTMWECDEMDEDGYWCVSERYVFLAYEIGGVTGTPFPGFENASIVLEGTAVNAAATLDTREAAARPLVAAGGTIAAPVRPPRSWFFVDPPTSDDDPRLVLQPPVDPTDPNEAPTYAVPLTLGDDGSFFGSVSAPGVCHTGIAAGSGECVLTPESPTNYARLHLGATPCDDGSTVPTGVLVAGSEHAPLMLSAQGVRDHHANVSLQWADCRVVDTPYGPFACGALRPDVPEAMIRALSGSTLSGEWRDEEGRGLDLILAMSVSSPGFPVFREAIAASGGRTITIPRAATAVRTKAGHVIALAGGRPVVRAGAQVASERPCGCGGHGASTRRPRGGEVTRQDFDRLEAMLTTVLQRTSPMVDAAAQTQLARIGVGS